jgi:alkanesulfonate monooxygenase SsuD/methylene tetrahydromethanopterin reductase-like flavin-dependent oxidoreductase (luciferase family)
MLSEDLAQLREEFPGWRFGTVWASAATGPDARRLWARHAEILLSAWNAADLRAAINTERKHNGDDGGTA